MRTAALAGKVVQATCKKGSGLNTSLGDGSFVIRVTKGELPCVLRVTEAGGSSLHTLALGTGLNSGLSAVANITPLTQLLVARLAVRDPADFFNSFDSTLAASVTSDSVAVAQAAVSTMAQAGGINLAGFGDIITPAATSTQRSVQGLALAQIDSALVKSQNTLAEVTLAWINTTFALKFVPFSSTPMLPPELLFKPAAADCRALRSGGFWVLSPDAGAKQVSQMVIDASIPAIINVDGSKTGLVADGACRYLVGDFSGSNFVVSQAGVLALNLFKGGTAFGMAIGLPEQLHDMAEMAGSWNYATFRGVNPLYGSVTTTTWGSGGNGPQGVRCGEGTWDFSICVDADFTARLVVNPAGGFDQIDTDGTFRGRAFIYQSGNGDLLYLRTYADGGWDIGTRQRNVLLPNVAQSNTYWKLSIINKNLANKMVVQTYVVVSNDNAAGSWVSTIKDYGSDVLRPEFMLSNNPRQGFSFRPGGLATASDGSRTNADKTTQLDLRGMGVIAFFNQNSKGFRLLVEQPKP